MPERERELVRLQDTVMRLREENEALRRSAGTFAELAERLSSALREERQRTDSTPAATTDGRSSHQH
jgi:hypothetical protein